MINRCQLQLPPPMCHSWHFERYPFIQAIVRNVSFFIWCGDQLTSSAQFILLISFFAPSPSLSPLYQHGFFGFDYSLHYFKLGILKLDCECGLGVKGSFSLYWLVCHWLRPQVALIHSQSKADAFSRVRYPLCVCLCLVNVHFGAPKFSGFRVCATRSPASFPKESKIVQSWLL